MAPREYNGQCAPNLILYYQCRISPLFFNTAASGMTLPSSSPISPQVFGVSVTLLTQCVHWSSPLDIIAIKHACCNKFYACISCHNASETHKPDVWSRSQQSEKAVLCGNCKHVLAVDEYMQSGSTCTKCGSAFNPGCKGHWGMYFELGEK